MKQMVLYGTGNERYGGFPIINDSMLLMPDGAEVPVEYDPNGRRRHHFFHEWNELDKHLPFDCFRKANRYAKHKDRSFVGEPDGYAAYCNAFDCIVYGWGRDMWDDLGVKDADEIWGVAERAAAKFIESLT